MNAPTLLLIAAWLLFASIELAMNFPARQNGLDSPVDAPPADVDEDSDNLPFGPVPSDQD